MHTSVNGNKNQGFTIIELLLVLAITGLLMTMTFFGQGSIRTQSQFRDSVEEFRASMESVKDQANTGVSSGSQGCTDAAGIISGNEPTCVLYGRVFEFANTTDDYTITPVTGSGPKDFAANKSVTNPQPRTNFEIKKKLLWGTKFNVDPVTQSRIGFLRHAGSGKLETHVIPKASLLNDKNSYQNPGKEYTIRLVGTACDNADVIFNKPANTIRVEFKDVKTCI